MIAKCGYEKCGVEFEILTGEFNRAVRMGRKVFCCREHFGLASRVNKSVEQKKKEKAEYDKIYREEEKSIIKKITMLKNKGSAIN